MMMLRSIYRFFIGKKWLVISTVFIVMGAFGVSFAEDHYQEADIPALLRDMQFEAVQVQRDMKRIDTAMKRKTQTLKENMALCPAAMQLKSSREKLDVFTQAVERATQERTITSVANAYTLFTLVHGDAETPGIRAQIYGGYDLAKGKKTPGLIEALQQCRASQS